MDFDLDKFQKDLGIEYRLVFDVFTSYICNILEGPNKNKHLSNLSKEQINQIIDWIDNHVIPFYEDIEEFERCIKLKNISNLLKQNKGMTGFD